MVHIYHPGHQAVRQIRFVGGVNDRGIIQIDRCAVVENIVCKPSALTTHIKGVNIGLPVVYGRKYHGAGVGSEIKIKDLGDIAQKYFILTATIYGTHAQGGDTSFEGCDYQVERVSPSQCRGRIVCLLFVGGIASFRMTRSLLVRRFLTFTLYFPSTL